MARVTAETLSRKQREISVSEFFAKNRHLLGFDSLRKALLTTVKEAVDNSLDACEEAGILPEIWVELEAARGTNRYLVRVTDNGPRYRAGTGAEDLRSTPVRVEVPQPEAEPGTAGNRHLGGGDVRAVDDRQAGIGGVAYGSGRAGLRDAGRDRHEHEQAEGDRPPESARLAPRSRHAGRGGTGGEVPQGPPGRSRSSCTRSR